MLISQVIGRVWGRAVRHYCDIIAGQQAEIRHLSEVLLEVGAENTRLRLEIEKQEENE